jgi:hypothetical protein
LNLLYYIIIIIIIIIIIRMTEGLLYLGRDFDNEMSLKLRTTLLNGQVKVTNCNRRFEIVIKGALTESFIVSVDGAQERITRATGMSLRTIWELTHLLEKRLFGSDETRVLFSK